MCDFTADGKVQDRSQPSYQSQFSGISVAKISFTESCRNVITLSFNHR